MTALGPGPATQLGILVLDASGSMSLDPETLDPPTGTDKVYKAWQVEEAVCRPLSRGPEMFGDQADAFRDAGLIARLQESKVYRSLAWIAIIRFDTEADLYLDAKRARDITLDDYGTIKQPPDHFSIEGKPFMLLDGKGNRTNIASGLALAHHVSQNWLEHQKGQGNEDNAFVTILLMSDMRNTEGPQDEAIRVAQVINQNRELAAKGSPRPQVVLAGAAYGKNADIRLMRQLATPGPYAEETPTPQKLRDFFLRTMTGQDTQNAAGGV